MIVLPESEVQLDKLPIQKSHNVLRTHIYTQMHRQFGSEYDSSLLIQTPDIGGVIILVSKLALDSSNPKSGLPACVFVVGTYLDSAG